MSLLRFSSINSNIKNEPSDSNLMFLDQLFDADADAFAHVLTFLEFSDVIEFSRCSKKFYGFAKQE